MREFSRKSCFSKVGTRQKDKKKQRKNQFNLLLEVLKLESFQFLCGLFVIVKLSVKMKNYPFHVQVSQRITELV